MAGTGSKRSPSRIAEARREVALAEAASAPAGAPEGSRTAYLRQLVQALEPWDRMTGETDLAWSLFVIWRDLPPHERSYAEVARRARREGRARGRDPKVIGAVAEQFQWTRRSLEWDRRLDRVTQAELIAGRQVLARKMATVADKAMALVEHELDRLLVLAQNGAEVLPARDLAKLVERFVPVGLRARDLPEHTVLAHHTGAAMDYAPSAQGDADSPVSTVVETVSMGALMGDEGFRDAVLGAMARVTAQRTPPPAAIDVQMTQPAPAAATAADPTWTEDEEAWPEDGDMDPAVTMDADL